MDVIEKAKKKTTLKQKPNKTTPKQKSNLGSGDHACKHSADKTASVADIFQSISFFISKHHY